MLTLHNVHKHYQSEAGHFSALENINLHVDAGELLFVVGPSGSGKSTLLNLIGGLDTASSGELHIANTPIFALNPKALTRFRGRHIGIVFQFFQLLPTLTCVENIVLAMDFVGKFQKHKRHQRAMNLLARVGIQDQAQKFPSMLSGGQQQRVAIARALANEPDVLIADEPTGNLDTQTAAQVMNIFEELALKQKAVIVVTHNLELAQKGPRHVRLVDGRIE